MQRVNLYEVLVPPKSGGGVLDITLKKAMYGWVVVLSVLIGVGNLFSAEVPPLEVQRNTIAKKRDAILTEISEISKREKEKPTDTMVDQKVRELDLDLRSKGLLLQQISQFRNSGREGFAAYLEGFSRQDTESIWLKRIEIFGSDKRMNVEGYAVNASEVPKWIERLRDEQVFLGYRYDALKIDRSKDNEEYMTFSFTTNGKSGK